MQREPQELRPQALEEELRQQELVLQQVHPFVLEEEVVRQERQVQLQEFASNK